MNRLFTLIVVMAMFAMSASAQLIDSRPVEGCSVTYPTASVGVDFPDHFVAAVASNYVNKGVLISRFDMNYSAYGTDMMIKSIQLIVKKHRNGKSGLVGNIPPVNEEEIVTVNFLPENSKMEKFKASQDIGDNGWDSIVIDIIPNSAVFIKKADFRLELL